MSKHNLYIAPKHGKYKLIITDKKTKEEVLLAEDENQSNLLQIMDQFPRSKYSRQLTGSDIYLYEG
tara:strand:- start:69 stop:266 length:198 start_codon:yes stop_codon:yes gene_type:complete